MSVIKLENVSKRFGGVEALSDFTMSVQGGSITGLIGPNGAGKSTVVNMITGIFKPTSGTISLMGHDVTQLSPEAIAKEGAARTFQNIRLLPEATVLENLIVGFHLHENTSFFANMFGLPSARRERKVLEQRAIKLLATLDMEEFANYLASELSYGHQRRLEILRALAIEPRLLLLDEPVAGMNDIEALELGKFLKKVANDGIAILLIEHNMRFISAVSDVVYVLNTGRVIASGTPAEINRNPDVIAAYLGE